MNPTLRNMLVSVGVVALGGVGFKLYTPQPASRTMAELRDAGIIDGQRIVLTCPERLTAQTKRRINAVQPGALRPKQSYARIARTARCFNPDGGNCFRPSDFLVRVTELEGEVVVPSLRKNLAGVDLDASVGVDDGGDSDDVDDAFQFRLDDCTAQACVDYDAGAGLFANPFCNNLNRLVMVPAPCMMPNGWDRGADGGWCEETECLGANGGTRTCAAGDTCGPVDCRCSGPYGLPDGGPRWRGFNVCPVQFASGAACVPTECGVSAGDVPQEWL